MRQARTLCAALFLGTIWACSTRIQNTDAGFTGDTQAIPGSYVTDANGTTLGKQWSYSGALVLDTTKIFGAVFTVQAGDGGTEKTSLHGTYRISTSTRRRNHEMVRTIRIILHPSDRGSDSHTLLFHGDSLTFDGPWWASAGLNALGVANPVFIRVADSSGIAAASSAPANTRAGRGRSATPVVPKAGSKAAK